MSTAAVDATFRGVGSTPGLLIWCVERRRLVPVPKFSHGKFYSGSCYIVLNTVLRKKGPPRHDIHYWLGKDTDEAEAQLASHKVLELDAATGSCSVQYREVQGYETHRFLSYFKPCIIPIEGAFSDGINGKPVCLLRCKGEHAVSVVEVPFSRSSLSHYDVFILDTEAKMYLFCGSKSSMQERAKALEVVQYIKDTKHGGRCEVSHIEDGKFVDDPEVGEFWTLFGGFAPLGRGLTTKKQRQPMKTRKLYWINKGNISPLEITKLERSILKPNWCYMLDCEEDIYVWMGRSTLVTERKQSISATEALIRSQDRSLCTHIIIMTEGSEIAPFKLQFDEWGTLSTSLYKDGREKVAAIFKYQGYDVKELPEDDYEPLIDCSGTPKVWLVDCGNISHIPIEEQSKLYSGNCYIVQYTYTSHDRDNHLFYAWFGKSSTMQDRVDGISQMNTMIDSAKCHPVMAQIFEGKEPDQFLAIFKNLVVLNGGTSLSYKRFIQEKYCIDETYNKDIPSLFRVQGTSQENMQAIQVDLASSSLNSTGCYILQDATIIYTWAGILSTARDRDILYRMLQIVNPFKQPISVREGNEPDDFWKAIGGKMDYCKEKEIKSHIEDPHLFLCITREGDLKWKEIYTFSQDDLTTEDVLVLDCHHEIFVWVGKHAGIKSIQEALVLGKKFLEADCLLEELSLETAIHVVSEGFEPLFFTCFFDWDSSKAHIDGNSFERKLTILKGTATSFEESSGSVEKFGQYLSEFRLTNGRKPSFDRRRMRSASPALSSQLDIIAPQSRRSSSPILIRRDSNPDCKSTKVEVVPMVDDGTNLQDNLKTIPYELLKVPLDVTVTGIDMTKREAYLSDEEFQEKFGMTKEAFYRMPFWKQKKMKINLKLF